MANDTSAIYKIDGYRILAASVQRALGDSNGDDITATYLKKADINNASGKWEDAADAVDTYSGDWNEVSAKLDTDEFETWSATADVTPYTAANNYIDITDHSISGYDWTNTITASADAASANAVSTVEGKFSADSNNKITGYNGSAFANDKYTAGNGIAITNNEISVSGEYVTSAAAGLTGNLVLNNNQWVAMPEMGGYTTADGTGADLHPDVQSPSHKLIYLVQDTTATGPDTYKEWIYSSENAWVLIGDTTLDLTNYATTAWVDGNYVDTASTAGWDVTEYSGKDGISVSNHEIGLSSDYVTAIQDVSGKLTKSDFDTWSGAATTDITPYSAGANINITDHVISGKDWTTEIQTASSDAVTEVGNKFATSSDGTNTYITSYNSTAFYTPDMSEYVTTSVYNTNSAVWQDAASCLSANSGAWTHAFTMVEVPDLANVPDITNP